MTDWNYKGWSISVDPKPIPVRDFDWTATSPDYDCDCDQDGFYCCSGAAVHAATYEDLLIEIEDWLCQNSDINAETQPCDATSTHNGGAA